jgi:hypothetical protein
MSFIQVLQDFFSSPVTETAAWVFSVCFLLSVLIVLTKKLHGTAVSEMSEGIQKFYSNLTPTLPGF